MKFKIAFLTAAAAFALQSCLMEDMRSTGAIFEVSDISVPADSAESYGKGTGTVTAYLPVRSTESWSAQILDDSLSTWLEIVSPDFNNPGGADVTERLKLVCADNEEYAPRSAKLRFTTKNAQIRDITVTQRSKSDRISVDGDVSFSLDAESETSVKVKILSNGAWTAEVDSASTCSVSSISPSEGDGDEIVTIIPSANYDCTGSAVALVRFAVPGDTVTVTLTRAADAPFISVYPVNVSQSLMPVDTAGTFIFNCNSPWKAEVVECTIKDFQLDTLQGEGGMETELPFTMSSNDGDESLSAKVRISLSDSPQKYVTVSVTQYAGFTLYVDFSNVTSADLCPLQPADSTYPQIPYTESDAQSLNNSAGNPYRYKYLSPDGKEYVFEIKDALFNVYAPSAGTGYLRLSQGYVKFPAVEGYRLAYVEFKTAATDKKYCISADEAGSEIVGKTQTLAKEKTASWQLEGTEYGKAYYERALTAKTRQHNLKLLYVK